MINMTYHSTKLPRVKPILPLLFLLMLTGPLLAKTYPITDFGAVGDGKTINTRAINEAVSACNAAGGGTVLVPVGTFLSGTIRLLSNVNLHLEAGSVLKGSPNVADYQLDGVKRGLIFAFEAENLSITGTGILDGNSDVFHDPKRMHGFRNLGFDRQYTRQGAAYMPADKFNQDGPIYYDSRPDKLVQLFRCERIVIRDAQFLNSPEWTFRIGDCDNVLVDGITVRTNLAVPNSDGIHTTTSRNVRIANCFVSAGDDAIVVTGFGDDIGTGGRMDNVRNYGGMAEYPSRRMGNKTGYAENVVVSNCVLQSRSAGIRVGYGDNSIRNCLFQNIVIFGSNRGIGVFARDRADIENIVFQNIRIDTRLHDGHWWGKGEPIHLSLTPQATNVPLGHVRGIQFRDITAHSQAGAVVWGEPDNRLRDVLFQNVELTISAGPLSKDWGGNFDLRPALQPDRKLFKHDIPGLYATNVDGLTLDHLTVRWGDTVADFNTYGVEIENVTNLRTEQYHGRGATARYQALRTVNAKRLADR